MTVFLNLRTLMDITLKPGRSNEELAALLPFPSAEANKYTRGHLYLVAGSAAYPGAACLAATGAARAGAGYTEVFCAGKSMITVRAWLPSLVVRDWRTWHPARFEAPKPGHPAACVIGCGFDPEDSALEPLVMETLRAYPGPVLIDGGALALLATPTGLRLTAERAEASPGSTGENGGAAAGPLVLTPHGGEAARLARGARLPSFGGDTPALAVAIARAYEAVVVLKGPVTYIATADGAVEAMERGTAALAKAGTGDVLAGVLGALLAQGMAPVDAAALGCALHAEAGRAAAEELTAIGVTAEDVAAALPAAIRRLME